MTRDEVNRLRAGDVVEFSAAGYQARWTIHDIVRRRDGNVLGILARAYDCAPPRSINITTVHKCWTLVERAKQYVHPLEQLRQRLDNNNDS